MFRELRAALGLLILFTLLTGLAYPFLMLGLGHTLFPYQANGSLISEKDVFIGSLLIGQNFKNDIYFHPRPSAAGDGYDAANSSGSNLAPSSPDLLKAVNDRLADLRKDSGSVSVPVDLVTSSASGLDPDISPAAAHFQAVRVANARHLPIVKIEELITQKIEKPALGFMGDSRVNVLELNRALDRLPPSP